MELYHKTSGYQFGKGWRQHLKTTIYRQCKTGIWKNNICVTYNSQLKVKVSSELSMLAIARKLFCLSFLQSSYSSGILWWSPIPIPALFSSPVQIHNDSVASQDFTSWSLFQWKLWVVHLSNLKSPIIWPASSFSIYNEYSNQSCMPVHVCFP